MQCEQYETGARESGEKGAREGVCVREIDRKRERRVKEVRERSAREIDL